MKMLEFVGTGTLVPIFRAMRNYHRTQAFLTQVPVYLLAVAVRKHGGGEAKLFTRDLRVWSGGNARHCVCRFGGCFRYG